MRVWVDLWGAVMTYREYLQTEHWQLLRHAVFERDGRRCTLCKTERQVQVHHWRYRATFFESVEADLFPLCNYCHSLVHRSGHGSRPKHELKEIYRGRFTKRHSFQKKKRFVPDRGTLAQRKAAATQLDLKWRNKYQ